MKLPLLSLLLAAFGLAQIVSGAMKAVAPPGMFTFLIPGNIPMLNVNVTVDCMTKCWDYSKIVTSCKDATSCLCADEMFQTVSQV